MSCQLCNSNLVKPETRVSMRTPTSAYDIVCRRCVAASKNRQQLYKLEQALRDYEAARTMYHESAYINDNWVTYYDELRCLNLFGDLPNYIFND